MKVGIPKALLYFKYAHLWEGFFKALGVDYIVSPDTNKGIIKALLAPLYLPKNQARTGISDSISRTSIFQHAELNAADARTTAR